MRQRSGCLVSQIAQDFECRVKLLQPSLSPSRVTQRVLAWSGEQPFLTYRLYELLLQGPLASWALPTAPLPNSEPVFDEEATWVDDYVQDRLIKHCSDPELVEHLREICKCMIQDPRSLQMLRIYRRLLAQRGPQADLANDVHQRLLQSGLAKIEADQLVLSNRFYGEVFNRRWLVRAFKTVEARLRDEAIAAINAVFAEQRSRSLGSRPPMAQALHPELQEQILLLENRGSRHRDLQPMYRPEQPYRPGANPFRRRNRAVLHLTLAMLTCSIGAVSILLMVHINNRQGGIEPWQPPSMHQIREFFGNIAG